MSQEIQTSPVEEVVVLDEIVEDTESTVKYIGQCKWFSDKLGYGFLTICDGDKKGMDIFAHHSGIKPLNSNYRTLKKGEYIQFTVVNGMNGLQATNITGINGGALMCDFVTPKLSTSVSQEFNSPSTRNTRRVHVSDTNDWQQVHPKKSQVPLRKKGSSRYQKRNVNAQ